MMQYEGLTRVQVEAFKECFDLIRNGYREITAYSDCYHWYIKLRHERKRKRIEVYIQDFSYQIVRNGNTIKCVTREPSPERYRLEVDSENNNTNVIAWLNESKKQISNSDLTNQDER